MNRQDFGKLIIALRKEHSDENAEIWTQQKLAEEANLTPVIVGNIERGKKANLEPETLLALANALRLTNGERKEFILAASRIDNEDIPQDNPPEVILNELLGILENMRLPAFIMDSFGETVAGNEGSLRMFNVDESVVRDSSVNQAIRFNIMRFVCSEEFNSQRKMMGEVWPRFIHSTMTIFRTASLRYRAHPYFRYIFPELKQFRLFRDYWKIILSQEQEYRQYIDNILFSANHPQLGSVQSITSAIRSVTKSGDLYLFSFVPLNSTTASIFFEMGKENTPIYRWASWPDKQVPDK